jgi:hypothetical protein
VGSDWPLDFQATYGVLPSAVIIGRPEVTQASMPPSRFTAS